VRAKPLNERIITAFVWLAAFCLASGVFLSLTLLLRSLPPTHPVAVGLVTIERYSKLRDYVAAALFMLLVPPLTIWLRGLLGRVTASLDVPSALLFTAPYVLSPLFYLTTGKVGWILLLPIALSFAGPKALEFTRTRRWFRDMFRRDLRPYHALLFSSGLAWILYRYIAVGKRIGHFPTLFLETVFVAVFLGLFWAAALLIARLARMTFAADHELVFRRIAVASLPLIVLPVTALIWYPQVHARLFTLIAVALAMLIALRLRKPLAARTAWKLAAYVVLPLLIFVVSYGSTAHLSQWVDLFHRGESVGPASDYLRGKVPYRDVFALHGMLEDGQLDAWLMELFGRDLGVAINRTVILGAFLPVAIWFLGIVVFDSIPLALLCVAMGSWTTTENNRTLLQVAAVVLFWNALRRRSRMSAVLSGVVAGIALFFSFEIGLYSVAGALIASLVIWIASTRVEWNGLNPGHAALFFAIGTSLGAAPFAMYLAMRGALDDYFVTSFVVIPRIIDAVWALPFPDLVSTFRRNLNLHVLAEFVLWEKFHLILSPLTIVVAAIYVIQRWLRRRTDMLDYALIVLAVFAAITQRTAFGRAEFRHQYFAAFLIGPMLVLLGIVVARGICGVWREGNGGTRAFLAALIAIAIPVVGVLFWIPDLLNVRIDDLTRYNARAMQIHKESHAEAVRWRIIDVTGEIARLTKKNEPIFDFSNQPAFYFFADRPNPTRFYQVPILSPAEFQAETIRALERAKPKVIIRRSPELYDQFDGVTNDLRAQAVAAYIRDTYGFHRSVRGVELWTRRTNARARSVAEYLRLIRVPEKKELVRSGVQRMIFPAVGSQGGAGGSFWQSDLTIHNPFREPLRLSMRWVTHEGGIDRDVTFAPRQTLRWPDVVRTLFGAQGGVGTLWIEHREGRAPVAVVKTADVAHNGRASIEPPLTLRDAATASTESAELSIVGIPSIVNAGRRVNVGMANIGIIPATFRLVARTRTGEQAGKAVEGGVPEDNVWFVNDVEAQLGVKLDETMTLRVTVIAGTGVAFASVIEPSGDAEFIAAIPTQQQEQ
jgi:hypothetical protein